jgi:hypothetical protein
MYEYMYFYRVLSQKSTCTVNTFSIWVTSRNKLMKTAVKRIQNVMVETLAWKIQHHLCKFQKVLNIDNSSYVFLEINLSVPSLAIRKADEY